MKLTVLEKIDRQIAILKAQNKYKHLRPRRQLYGVRMSLDHGRNWFNRVLCRKCVGNLEEPTRAVYLGLAGSKACDQCEALNK